MITHAPANYHCPMCAFVGGDYSEHNAASDLVVDRGAAFALISPKWWPDNPGGALIVPREHIENIYDLHRDTGHAVWDLVQDVAIAMRRAYPCEGITVRQHNEPAGNQDMWHFHTHVIPRYTDDELYELNDAATWHSESERAPFAEALRKHSL
ncbi:MAG: HIT family protein [Mycobacteriaceae bacterium]